MLALACRLPWRGVTWLRCEVLPWRGVMWPRSVAPPPAAPVESLDQCASRDVSSSNAEISAANAECAVKCAAGEGTGWPEGSSSGWLAERVTAWTIDRGLICRGSSAMAMGRPLGVVEPGDVLPPPSCAAIEGFASPARGGESERMGAMMGAVGSLPLDWRLTCGERWGRRSEHLHAEGACGRSTGGSPADVALRP